ncbi:MAG: 2-amino-4-hydroxy-6-hydroxymethyldihydropteridine diphosphokinase [Actinobacteria bacterium]|nr:2-amino-4-hydroxy-6-hydroxymethyldihydropteridine diphosphokinase [Actinomycetota bacterium]
MAEIRCYLGLGSNIGDREINLRRAVDLLTSHPEIRVTRVSSIFQTSPMHYLDQPLFLNVALEAETSLTPEELLEVCKQIEKDVGREENFRFGPRKVDVDILLYDEMEIDEEGLRIPHSRMLLRKFVLIPLLEIDKKIKLPDGGSLKAALLALGEDDEVNFYKKW